jgi:hypothetical protein
MKLISLARGAHPMAAALANGSQAATLAIILKRNQYHLSIFLKSQSILSSLFV